MKSRFLTLVLFVLFALNSCRDTSVRVPTEEDYSRGWIYRGWIDGQLEALVDAVTDQSTQYQSVGIRQYEGSEWLLFDIDTYAHREESQKTELFRSFEQLAALPKRTSYDWRESKNVCPMNTLSLLYDRYDEQFFETHYLAYAQFIDDGGMFAPDKYHVEDGTITLDYWGIASNAIGWGWDYYPSTALFFPIPRERLEETTIYAISVNRLKDYSACPECQVTESE